MRPFSTTPRLDDARSFARVLIEHQPDKGHCPWTRPLRDLLSIPGMSRELRDRVMDYDDAPE